MFIFRALSKRGPFHAAKVQTFLLMCNTLGPIFSQLHLRAFAPDGAHAKPLSFNARCARSLEFRV